MNQDEVNALMRDRAHDRALEMQTTVVSEEEMRLDKVGLLVAGHLTSVLESRRARERRRFTRRSGMTRFLTLEGEERVRGEGGGEGEGGGQK